MSQVRVRMYRQGLGDCFLLSFPRHGGRTSSERVHVLIDCGVLLGTRGAAEKMSAVAQDIARQTDRRLDVVVGTHEHWDHLSGFRQAQVDFDAIAFEQVWLGWTEDPEDLQASRLADDRAARVRMVATAAQKMRGTPLAASASFRMSAAALAFFGVDAEAREFGVQGANGTRAALEYLRARGATAKGGIRFQEPGTTFLLKGTRNVRVFVLGPPREERWLRKDLPSKRTPETYEEAPPVTGEASLAAAIMRTATSVADDGAPFDAHHRVSPVAAQRMAFFQRHYGFGDDVSPSPPWRRIDDDWLSCAGQVALALDSDTNNTSLVLAFELGEGGPVMLFAADAQVGNWMSWHERVFRHRGVSGERTVTADDLLSRTVLYKVGHHGSHNATLREGGLERMNDRRLVALIPVDAEMARARKWRMPFAPLVARLEQRCRGRVVRSDEPRATKSVAVDDLGVDVRIEFG